MVDFLEGQVVCLPAHYQPTSPCADRATSSLLPARLVTRVSVRASLAKAHLPD